MRWVRRIGIVVGVALLAWAVAAVGWPAIWQELRRLGWRLAAVLMFYLVIFGLDTWGWRYAFTRHPKAPWGTLFLARLAGEAVNYVTPFAWVGGEPVKAYLLRQSHGVPMREGISSVVIAKTTLAVGLLLFALSGIGLAVWQAKLSAVLARASWGVFVGLSILMGLFIVAQRWGLFRRVGPQVRRVVGSHIVSSTGVRGREIDVTIRRFYRSQRGRLALSVGFHFLGWVAGAAEVWFILQCLGIPITLAQAWIIESLWQLLKAGAFLIPAGLGAQEGGILLICVALGLSLPSGLAMALVRRIRELFWTAVGLAVWSRYEYAFAKG